MDADPDAELGVRRPCVGGQPALCGRSSQCGVACTWEHVEKGVTLGVDLLATVFRECLAQYSTVFLQRRAVVVPELLEEPGGPLDVGEEKRDRSLRTRCH